MSRSSRTNWTQEASQRSRGKDFYDSERAKAKAWSYTDRKANDTPTEESLDRLLDKFNKNSDVTPGK